jgi:hypothetical protein
MPGWRRARLFAALAIPALSYPVLLLAMIAQDSLAGDESFIHHLLYESRRALAFTALADWARALPWLYAIIVPLWFAATALFDRIGAHRVTSLGFTGAFAGAVIASFLVGTFISAAVLSYLLAGALTGIALGAALPKGAIVGRR